MKINRSKDMLHPILISCINRIDILIEEHNMPFKLFETGRSYDRHQQLIAKGKTKDLISMHLYNLENDPPLYTTAIDYVFYNGNWSWNLRDGSIKAWYILFGNLVLDSCPELQWFGYNRKSLNYYHFQIRKSVLIDNLDVFKCVTS